MRESQETETGNAKFLFLFFCLLVIILVGCEEEGTNKAVPEEKKQQDVTIKPLPLSDEKHTFQNAYGWISENSILYSAKAGNRTVIMTYEFGTGKKKEIFSTTEMVGGVSISPNKEIILVYMPNGQNKMGIHILECNGKELYSFTIAAHELTVSWNPFSDNMILIDSFNEEWSFQSYICYFELGKLEKIALPKPFAQWQSAHSVVYLDWNEETPQLTTPLKSYDLLTSSSKDLYQDSITFRAEKEILLTINQHKEDSMALQYEFHKWNGQSYKTMKAPAIGSYSDWVIQPFELVAPKNTFITFVPYESALVDQYQKRYRLIAFNWKTGKQEVLKERIDAASIACSPQGNKCLYGNKLENSFEYKKISP